MNGKKWYTNVYILLVVLISLLGIATSSLLFLLIPQSSEIIRLMQWRMATARTFAVQAEMRYRGTMTVKDAQNVTRNRDEETVLTLQGLHDASDPKMLRDQQVFSATLGATDSLTFAGMYNGVGGARFFNFNQLPTQIGSLHFDEFRNRWLRVDVEKLFSDTDFLFVGGGHQEFSDEDRAYLLEQFRMTPFLRVKEKLKNESLGGVPTHHYQVEPITLFFKDYFVLAETKRLGRELTNKERDAADVFFSNITPDPAGCELWIGTRDYHLYRMRMRVVYDDDSGRKGVFTLTANFSHFNEPTVFDTPTSGVEDVTSVIASLLPGLSGHLPLANKGPVRRSTKESSGGLQIEFKQAGDVDTDHDGLTNALEKFYGTDPNNHDTDGNGVKDGDEVSAGCNPVGAGALFSFGLAADNGKCK